MDFILTVGVDLLFLAVIVTSVLSAMHKGFLKSILSIVALVLAFVVASVANEPAAEWCYDSFISNSVVVKVSEKIPDDTDNIEVKEEIGSFIDSLPTFVNEQLEKMDVDVDKSLEKISNKNLSSDEMAEEISYELIRPGVIMLLRLVCFLLIFLLLRLLFGFVAIAVSKVAKIPVLKQLNKGLGALLGLFKGVLCVLSLAFALNFISQLLKTSNQISIAIENSVICDIIGEMIK